MKEEFRWVKGFEGLYQISNLARVYSFPRVDALNRKKGGHFVSTRKLPKGYVIISLNKDGVQYTRFLHKLVAEAFLPNPQGKPEVDHIDTDKNNNTVSNLRWVTRAENMNNPITYSAMSGNAMKNPVSGAKNPFSRSVAQYSFDGELIAEFESVGLASKTTGLSHTSIQRCAKGINKSGGGYVWKYTSEAQMKATAKSRKGVIGHPISQIDKDGNVVAEYVSIQEAARQTGFLPENIGRAARGVGFKTYKGFKWRFIEQ